MMKGNRVLSVWLLIVLTSTIKAQISIPKNEVYSDSLNLKYKKIKDIDSGTWFKFDNSKRKVEELNFLDNITGSTYHYDKEILVSLGLSEYVRLDSGLSIQGLSYFILIPQNDTILSWYFNNGVPKWIKRKEADSIIIYRELSDYNVFNGVEKGYYPSGALKYLGSNNKNHKCGKWTNYFENGNVLDIGNYSGKFSVDSTDLNSIPKELWDSYPMPISWLKKGRWRYFNKAGKLIRIERYNRRGELVRTKEF